MFDSDFWRILKLVYIIVKALLSYTPGDDDRLPPLNGKD